MCVPRAVRIRDAPVVILVSGISPIMYSFTRTLTWLKKKKVLYQYHTSHVLLMNRQPEMTMNWTYFTINDGNQGKV